MDVFSEIAQDPTPRKRPAATIVSINGNRFVSGLLWQALTRPRGYMKEAKEIGKREGLDIVAIRDTAEVKQAGFVSKADGAYKGMYSLAAALAGQLGDTWIGAFKLPDDRYAMVAVDSGAIIPGADKIGDKDAIQKQLRRIFARGTTDFKDNIFAPAELEFGGIERDIEDLLKPSNLKKEYTLKPLTFGLTKKEWIGVGVAAGVLACTMFGLWQWQLAVERAEREARILAAQLEAKRLEELNAKTRAEQQAPALKHPWATMIGVGDFVTSCSQVSHEKPLALGGWVAISANCKPDLFAISYARTGSSTVNQLIAAAQGLFELAPAFTEGGDKASLNEPIEMTVAGDEELRPLDDALASFNSHLQQVQIKPELVEVPYTPPPAPEPLPGADPAVEPPAPPVPDWFEFTFSFDTDIPPEILVQGLPGRGVRITEIDITRNDLAQLTWTIKGAIYAKK
ncbi:hypothetical protein B6S59_31240 [Pseudomonas sp. A46]|nr:type 4b pilus protein PilO2 [Pseudomonas sp. A46]OWJ89359.1 hypothetical protein B6S59_31240 [Pseudomonas sp. A46]